MQWLRAGLYNKIDRWFTQNLSRPIFDGSLGVLACANTHVVRYNIHLAWDNLVVFKLDITSYKYIHDRIIIYNDGLWHFPEFC